MARVRAAALAVVCLAYADNLDSQSLWREIRGHDLVRSFVGHCDRRLFRPLQRLSSLLLAFDDGRARKPSCSHSQSALRARATCIVAEVPADMNERFSAAVEPARVSPWTRSFGIEFEFPRGPLALTKGAVIKHLRKEGYTVDEVDDEEKHEVTNGWKVVHEWSSVRPKRRKLSRKDIKKLFLRIQKVGPHIEVVSPMLYGREGLQEVMKMCKTLHHLGVTIPKEEEGECSLHVHIGATDLDGDALAHLILFHHHIEQDIDGLLNCVAPARRENRWCKATNPAILDAAEKGPITFQEARDLTPEYEDRWVSLNMFQRCEDYGTIEFRRHGGTVQRQEALSWIILCLFMVEASRSLGRRGYGRTLQEAFVSLGMFHSGELAEWAATYLLERRNYFCGRGASWPSFQESWLKW